MREIKFRAWDKKEKLLHTGIDWLDIGLDGKIYNMQISEGLEETERYILMQYTGLKDKNGKEIYEGDILFSKKSWYGCDMEYVVFWHNKEACFFLDNKKYMEFPMPLSVSNPDGCGEVIGNIYENPELLEEKK